MRQHYLTVFPENSYARLKDQDEGGEKLDTSAIHKIEYSVNLLPMVAHTMETNKNDKYSKFLNQIEKIEVDLMYLISQCEEVPLFKTKPVMDLIDYQWNETGFNFHSVGLINFLAYLLILIIYIYQIYIHDGLYEWKGD